MSAQGERRATVVCTDKGMHPPRTIGDLYALPAEVIWMPWIRAINAPGTPQRTGTITLRCPTCRRNTPLRQENARRLVEAADAVGLSRLDLSNL